jgi:hypothetical protein
MKQAVFLGIAHVFSTKRRGRNLTFSQCKKDDQCAMRWASVLTKFTPFQISSSTLQVSGKTFSFTPRVFAITEINKKAKIKQ